jgi:hypothetical protein
MGPAWGEVEACAGHDVAHRPRDERLAGRRGRADPGLQERSTIEVKGMGPMTTYRLIGPRADRAAG